GSWGSLVQPQSYPGCAALLLFGAPPGPGHCGLHGQGGPRCSGLPGDIVLLLLVQRVG
ncbi:unnamed protein product, partial [Gulo gulo]